MPLWVSFQNSEIHSNLKMTFECITDVGHVHVFHAVAVRNGTMSRIFAHNVTEFWENIDRDNKNSSISIE